jgi:hypothetical protein
MPQRTCTGEYDFNSSTSASTSRLANAQDPDDVTMTRSGAPSSASTPQVSLPFELRSRQDQTYSSEPLPAQAAKGSESATSTHSSTSFSSWASPTTAALQACNVQRQAPILPTISTTETVQISNTAPTGSTTGNPFPRASTVQSWSQQNTPGHLGRLSGIDPTYPKGLTEDHSLSVQIRNNLTSANESPYSSHEDHGRGAESMFILIANAASDSVHADEREHISTSIADGSVDLNSDGVSVNKACHTAPPRPPTTPEPQQYIPNMLPSPSSSWRSPHTPTKQAERTHSSQVSAAAFPTPNTPSTAGFRMPFLPASATKDLSQNAQSVRAGSQASNCSLAGSTTLRSQRSTSATSQISVSSRPNNRKRKAVNLSSDEEESDYSPPSDDGEDETDLAGKVAEEVRKESKMKAKKQGRDSVVKRTKLAPPPPSALPSTRVFSKGKNIFGFHHTPNALPHASTTKSQTSISGLMPGLRQTVLYQTQRDVRILPESVQPPLKANTATPIAGKHTTPTRTSQRKAKLDAEEKISRLSQNDSAFWTQETITEADEQEEPEAGIVGHMGGRLNDMNITHTRSVVGSLSKEANGEDQDEEVIVDVSDTEDASTRKDAGKRHDQDWASWQTSLERR